MNLGPVAWGDMHNLGLTLGVLAAFANRVPAITSS